MNKFVPDSAMSRAVTNTDLANTNMNTNTPGRI